MSDLEPGLLRDLRALAGLSDAQKAFLRDSRPYVKGGIHHPAVRTMRSLERRGLITVEYIPGGSLNTYETKPTELGNEAIKILLRQV